MDWTHLILTFISTIAGGGWFIQYKVKKQTDKVDLTDKILKRYQEGVLDAMGGHDEKVDKLMLKMDNMTEKVDHITEFLGSDFVEFQTVKRDEAGKFVRRNKLSRVSGCG